MSDRQQLREEVVKFLNTVAKPGCQVDRMDDAVNLIDAGIIDSLAVVQIILYLEENYNISLQSSGIDPADLASIDGILAAVARSRE
jgi:D-alanine--poly(phosphoribitol) ligase subunit 2